MNPSGPGLTLFSRSFSGRFSRTVVPSVPRHRGFPVRPLTPPGVTMGLLENRFEDGFVVTSLEQAVNWALEKPRSPVR